MSGTFVYHNKSFDLSSIMKASKLERLDKLLHLSVENASSLSLTFLNTEYKNKSLFSTALKFLDYNVPEIIQSLSSGLGFPLLEMENILNRSLYLGFAAFYKEAIVNLRSALELSLVISRFYTMAENSFSIDSLTDINGNYQKVLSDVKKWLSSESETPKTFKLKNVNHLLKLDECTMWFKDFDYINGKLNDFIHTNGIKYTNIKLHGNTPSFNYPPDFNKKSLELFFEFFIIVIQHIAIISAASRPELLNEDMAYQIEKQINEPLIGDGFWGGAVSNFFDLVPVKYKEYFKRFHVEPMFDAE